MNFVPQNANFETIAHREHSIMEISSKINHAGYLPLLTFELTKWLSEIPFFRRDAAT
jgi:hypothetical protein